LIATKTDDSNLSEAPVQSLEVPSFEEALETLARLEILALGDKEVEVGRVQPVADVLARLRRKPSPTGSSMGARSARRP